MHIFTFHHYQKIKSWKLLPTFVSHLARFNFVLANFKFSFSLHLVVDLLLFSSPKALYTNRAHSRLGSHSSIRVDRQIFITSADKMAFNINQQRQSKRHKTKSIGSPVSHIYFLLPVEKKGKLFSLHSSFFCCWASDVKPLSLKICWKPSSLGTTVPFCLVKCTNVLHFCSESTLRLVYHSFIHATNPNPVMLLRKSSSTLSFFFLPSFC